VSLPCLIIIEASSLSSARRFEVRSFSAAGTASRDATASIFSTSVLSESVDHWVPLDSIWLYFHEDRKRQLQRRYLNYANSGVGVH
jgi:hypothetical protein